MALLNVNQNISEMSMGCCQALCAKNSSCAAFQSYGETCLMSDMAYLLILNTTDALVNTSVFVKGPKMAIYYNVSIVNAPGELL